MKKMLFEAAGLIIFTFTCSLQSIAQSIDTLSTTPLVLTADTIQRPLIAIPTVNRTKTPVIEIVVPAAMIGYGVLALSNTMLKNLNASTKTELKEDHPQFKTHIDNYLQYAPVVAVYALNAAGIAGKHSLRDRTIILGMAAVITASTVEGVKRWTHEERPDASDYLSFPSGHTATAFAAAEFLRQEYHDVSPWYGVGGYLAAATTGALRMYNNKHWLSDVIAGAGVGILSTKAAYWLFPLVQQHIFNNRNSHTQKVVMPFYNPSLHTAGIGVTFFPH
ncbi:phosphatase PAP2 family protein [Chitinophaga sp. 30R24]|uniref:phosphatase PAP2 family protein n=1 Tax=Chitinophaga sp. 30R24 TaxID=3248838 RepID=UPI003B8F5864